MTAHVSFYVIAILALRLKGHSLQERNVLGNVNIVDHPIQKIYKYYTLKPYYYYYYYYYVTPSTPKCWKDITKP